LLTTKDPVKLPLETEQVCVLTAFPEIRQPVSLSEKPEPVTSTVAPAGAAMGSRTIDGPPLADVELAAVSVELVAVEVRVV
jgi:hypothetical protein